MKIGVCISGSGGEACFELLKALEEHGIVPSAICASGTSAVGAFCYIRDLDFTSVEKALSVKFRLPFSGHKKSGGSSKNKFAVFNEAPETQIPLCVKSKTLKSVEEKDILFCDFISSKGGNFNVMPFVPETALKSAMGDRSPSPALYPLVMLGCDKWICICLSGPAGEVCEWGLCLDMKGKSVSECISSLHTEILKVYDYLYFKT